MVDRVDQDRRAEIPEEQGFIMAEFLREIRLDTKKKNSLPEDISNKFRSINENNIFSRIEFPKEKNPHEEIIPLNIINPLTLERENAGRRIDNFIRQIRIEFPQGVDYHVPADDLRVPGSDPKKWFSSPAGLRASAATGTRSLTVNGEKVRFEGYNDVHFTPEGRSHFDPSKMTRSLAGGIQGIVELIDAVDQGRFEAAPIFVGMTNINMALIAQRLGFVIIDECRNSDGSINKKLSFFTVVGKLADIRARVGELKKAGVAQKLEQRNQGLRAKPKLEPVGA